MNFKVKWVFNFNIYYQKCNWDLKQKWEGKLIIKLKGLCHQNNNQFANDSFRPAQVDHAKMAADILPTPTQLGIAIILKQPLNISQQPKGHI